MAGAGRARGPGPMSRTGPGLMSLATGPGPMAQAVDPGGVIGLGSVWARDQWPKPLTLFLLVIEVAVFRLLKSRPLPK